MRFVWPSLFLLVAVGCKKASPPPAPSASAAPVALPASAAPSAPSAAAAKGQPPALDAFEGEIGWTATTQLPGKTREPLQLTLLVKDGKLRIESPAGVPGFEQLGNAYLLGNAKSKEFVAVLDGQKQVVKIDFQKMSAQAEALAKKYKAGASAAAKKPPELEKTGKTDSVAGYSCELWRVTDAGSSTELCVAKAPAPWFGDALPMVPSEYGWAAELMDGKHFPLRVVASRDKQESMRLELTRIEAKPLDAALFQPPSGYRVIDLEQMLQALMMRMPGLSGARGAPPVLPPIPSAPPKNAAK
jgi:hypothetical protein